MAGGVDYFSQDFIDLACNSFGEAMDARAFVRVNDGTGGTPGTLIDMDGTDCGVAALGRISRRRERSAGVVQGQAWQVTLNNPGHTLFYFDFVECWVCLRGGFPGADEWATMAQGKIAKATYSAADTVTFEVHDSVMDLLNYSLAQDYFFDSIDRVGEVKQFSVSGESDRYDNDDYSVTITGSLADDSYVLEFTDPTHFKVIYSDGTEATGFDLSTDAAIGNPSACLSIPHDGWSTDAGAYVTGDQFVIYTTAARAPILLTPVMLVRHIIQNIAGITPYDVMAGSYYSTPFWDESAWSAALSATQETIDGDDAFALRGEWQSGVTAKTLVQDALKLINGSIYPTPTGQIGVWVSRPTGGGTVHLNGDPAAGQMDITDSPSMGHSLLDCYNSVTFNYLSLSGEDLSYTAVADDSEVRQTRGTSIDCKWRVRGEIVQSAANIFLRRHKNPRREYTIPTTAAGIVADVAAGVAIIEPDLRLGLTDSSVTQVDIDVLGNSATITAYNDPVLSSVYGRVDSAKVNSSKVW